MAKKSTTRKSTPRTTAPAKVVSTTSVRNSAIPRAVAPAAAVPTHDQIAQRAYDIYASGQGGSDYDNWCRAECELRAELSR